MSKVIKMLIVVLSVSLSQASAGIFSDKLSDKEIENFYLCENTKTGVARFSSGISRTASILRKSGVKFVVLKSGNELTIEIGQLEKIEIDLKKIDSGDLKKYNVVCYQAQELETPKGKELTRKDKTLNITTISGLSLFGRLLPTEKDKALAKEERDKANALEILKTEQKLEIKRAKQEKIAQIERNKGKVLRGQKRKEYEALNKKRNRYLSIIKTFEEKSKIHSLKDKKIAGSKLILTTQVLDDLVDLLDSFEAESIKSGYTANIKYDIDNMHRLFDDKEKIKYQIKIYSGYNGYLRWANEIVEKIKNMKK